MGCCVYQAASISQHFRGEITGISATCCRSCSGERHWKFDDFSTKELSVNKGEARVLYWFQAQNQTSTDYSERIWDGILQPGTHWMLVEVGFEGKVDVSRSEVKELLKAIKKRVKEFMF